MAKVLIATEKPFAAQAVNGIKEIIEGAGFELALLEKYTVCEMHTYSGRIDCRVQTNNYIYLFEFKRDDSADAALAQIDSKDYALPFIADSRKLYKIGVSFDSSTRKLVGWKVGE